MTELAHSAARDAYVMGRTSEEHQRLRAQARMWEPATRKVLEQAGLRPGMRCLDLGCGPGEVMRLMGEIVGPTGSVTGVDVDGRLGREALDVLREIGGCSYGFVEGDALGMDDVEGGPFDLTYARLVLIHADDPVELLRWMWDRTAPGGCLVVQDYDLGVIAVHPEYETWPEFRRVFDGVYAAAGRDIRIGHKLPAYFVDAGIGEPDGTDLAGQLAPMSRLHGMITAVYRSLLPRALELGLTTPERSEAFLRDTERAGTGERYHAGVAPLLMGAWKRKVGA